MKRNSIKEFEDKRWREGSQVFVFRHEQALAMIEKRQKVLDIASGDGLFLGSLAQEGVQAVGIDISEEGIRKCKEKGLNVVMADVACDPLPFHDEEFDVVTMLDVLEHLYDPEQLVREAARVSKRYIIISVPNFNSLPARLQVVFGRVPENNKPNKGHVFWFNYKNLCSMLNNAEMKIVDLRMNTFFESVPFVGKSMKLLAQTFSSLFALSFVVKVEK